MEALTTSEKIMVVCTSHANEKAIELTKILLHNRPTADVNMVKAFFRYWEDFKRGTWINETTFSHDHGKGPVEEGMLLNDDNITYLYDEFIEEICLDIAYNKIMGE